MLQSPDVGPLSLDTWIDAEIVANPAGVNLGAVMESIVRSDSFYFTSGAGKRLELSGSNAIVTINSPNNGRPVNYTIALNTLTDRNFSDVAL